MDLLPIQKINNISPYKIISLGENSYAFTTDNGINYEVGFIEDYMLGIDGVYQFFIEDKDDRVRVKDSKIAITINIILEEFFQEGNLILDYICDTSDGKQAARSRLFTFWYESNPQKSNFTYKSIKASYEGEDYYAAVILRNDNPRYSECMEAIDSFSKSIEDKLH